jgi:hypothetical protein
VQCDKLQSSDRCSSKLRKMSAAPILTLPFTSTIIVITQQRAGGPDPISYSFLARAAASMGHTLQWHGRHKIMQRMNQHS